MNQKCLVEKGSLWVHKEVGYVVKVYNTFYWNGLFEVDYDLLGRTGWTSDPPYSTLTERNFLETFRPNPTQAEIGHHLLSIQKI